MEIFPPVVPPYNWVFCLILKTLGGPGNYLVLGSGAIPKFLLGAAQFTLQGRIRRVYGESGHSSALADWGG